MDKFFKQTKCDRCGKPLTTRIMSMFNKDCICPECKIAEMKLPEYQKAVEAEHDAIIKGDVDFDGIGLPMKKDTQQ